MELLPDLHVDRHFRDFNFCLTSEPTLKAGSGPSQSELYKMAYLIRDGHQGAESDFASVMQCTLRQEAFQSFQTFRGPYAINYADWFYAKLEQFLGILFYDRLWVWGMGEHGEQGRPQTDLPWEEGNGILDGQPALVDLRQLLTAFSATESGQIDWFRIVHELAAIETDRTNALRRYLRKRAELARRRNLYGKRPRSKSQPLGQVVQPRDRATSHGTKKRRRGRSVQTRDSIILSGLDEGLGRLEICDRLDKKGVPTTYKMRKAGCDRWTDAWSNLDLRNNLQQVFSKTLARVRAVKT